MYSQLLIDDYFRRIGYSGSRKVSAETLKAIHWHHVRSIAFENINPLFGLPVKLDLESLQQKLIYDQRGGYCFENNMFLKYVLENLGFETRGLAARVLWNHDGRCINPRSHMLLLVNVENNRFIVDAGFGISTPTAPLRLQENIPLRTPHGLCRIVKDNNNYTVESCYRDIWKPLYQFDLTEHHLADYEVVNWYLCHHPDSPFLKKLVVSIADSVGRYTLSNNLLSVYEQGEEDQERRLGSIGELRHVLKTIFEIVVPETDIFNNQLAQFILSGRETPVRQLYGK